MCNFGNITEAQIKAEYLNTPTLCNYFTWEEILTNESFMIILKNQIIAHEQESVMEKPHNSNTIFLAIDNGNKKPVTALAPVPEVRTERNRNTEEKKDIKRSPVRINESQINQLRTSLRLARNCLMTNLGEKVKEEAIQELAISQKTIQSLFDPRN